MRTIEEIKAEQDLVQVKYPALTGLDSTSDVSFYASMKNMWALLVSMLEGDQATFKANIEAIIANTSVGSLTWYVDQVKGFQFGDSVSIIAGKVAYDKIDPEKQIIMQAAITEEISSGRLTIKAAKKSADGLVPLGVDELDALKDYVGKIKYAGVVVDVISMDADQLKIVATVKVDRQVISNTGVLLADTSKAPILAAINAYVAALPYDSVLSNTALTDAIQTVRGVKDFTIVSSFTRRPISDTWVAYNREVTSLPGHMKLHADSAITYTY